MRAVQFRHRVRRLERELGETLPAGEVPIAGMTLPDLVLALEPAEETHDPETIRTAYRGMARELQRRYLAGDRTLWPEFEEMRALREVLEEALTEPA